MGRLAGIVAGLLVLALVLFIVSLVLDALRWLIIVAVIVLLIAGAVGAVGRRSSGDGPG